MFDWYLKTLMKFKSRMVRILERVIFALPYALGVMEQSQYLRVKVMENAIISRDVEFVEVRLRPEVDIYNAKVEASAHFFRRFGRSGEDNLL